MKILVDTQTRELTEEHDGVRRTVPLFSKEAFDVLSEQWVRVGWSQKYSYAFSWLGRPIIQLPEDVIRMQEVLVRLRPDVVLETGVAHGGSLMLYASIFHALGAGRAIGIDREIRPHNRAAIESHALSRYITLVEGDSVHPDVVRRVKSMVGPSERVLVILDSNHSKAHVSAELEAYQGFVSPDSYIVVQDGIMERLHDVPGGDPQWKWDNPASAAREFAASHPEFVIETPPRSFSESKLGEDVTYWPSAWLRRAAR